MSAITHVAAYLAAVEARSDRDGTYCVAFEVCGEEEFRVTVADLRAAFTEALAEGWDAAVKSMVYEDGTPLDVVDNHNPYRRDLHDCADGGTHTLDEIATCAPCQAAFADEWAGMVSDDVEATT